MRTIAALIFTLLSATSSFAAEVIALKRGIPTDIWLTWPTEAALSDPALAVVFPEYRMDFKGDEFKAAKSAGFDFVRLTIDPAVFIADRSTEKTAKLIAGTKTAIAEIQTTGLKVIVDLHSMPRAGSDPGTFQIMASPQLFDVYLQVVKDVGTAIAEMPPEHIAFEPMNEPTADCVWDAQEGVPDKWPAMLQRMHETARAAAPKLTLVLSGGCWGGADGLVRIDPKLVQDDNIIWSFHNYEPYIFTHQGAVWTDGHERYLQGLRFPPDQMQKDLIIANSKNAIDAADLPAEKRAELKTNAFNDLNAYFDPGWAEDRLRQPFRKVEAWAEQHNIPASRIILGEFGAIREEVFTPERQKERANFYAIMTSEAAKRGYAWSTWSWSGTMGLSVSDQSRVLDPVMLKGLGLQ